MASGYNLMDEKWIPVLMLDGRYRKMSLIQTIREAGAIRHIAASNPMDRFAVFRFLLALLYWIKGNPTENPDEIADDPFTDDWIDKLEQHRDCFDLFGDGKRFYQYRASGSAKDKKLSATYLIHEVPTGTNLWHFKHSTDKVDGLCSACCAMGLLRLPHFTTSGGSGKAPGINMKPPLYVAPLGDSLTQTLLLSWNNVPDLGTPAWMRPEQKIPTTGEIPLLMGLTWLPRRVWLDDPEDTGGVCIVCGSKGPLVKTCIFAGAGSAKREDSGSGSPWEDPHTLFIEGAKGIRMAIRSADALGSPNAAAGQWTKLWSGIVNNHHGFASVDKIWVVGFSTVQNDKYLEATDLVEHTPQLQLGQEELIGIIELWREQTGKKLLSRVSKMIRNRKDILSAKSNISIISPEVEYRVSYKAVPIMSLREDAWRHAAEEYRPMMKVVARSLSPGFTTSALKRRKQIESTLPEMTLRKKKESTEGKSKGGN